MAEGPERDEAVARIEMYVEEGADILFLDSPADDAFADLRNFKTKVEVVNLAQIEKAFNRHFGQTPACRSAGAKHHHQRGL